MIMSGGSEKMNTELPHIMPDYMLVFAVQFLTHAKIPPMYFKPHEDPNFQNLQSFLPLELQHSQPKKASVAQMAPPLYTVSGQMANIEKGKEKEEEEGPGGDGESISAEEVGSEDQENSLGKRTRATTNGGSEAKKSRV